MESVGFRDRDMINMHLLRHDIQEDFVSATINPSTFNLTCYKCYHAANPYNAAPIRPLSVERPTLLSLAFGRYLEQSRSSQYKVLMLKRVNHSLGIWGIHSNLFLQKNSPLGGRTAGSSRDPTTMYRKSFAAASYLHRDIS